MICRICRQAKIVNGFTSIKLERGEMHLLIHRVPAQVCPRCGEAYVDGEITVQLLQRAEERCGEGVFDVVYDYTG